MLTRKKTHLLRHWYMTITIENIERPSNKNMITNHSQKFSSILTDSVSSTIVWFNRSLREKELRETFNANNKKYIKIKDVVNIENNKDSGLTSCQTEKTLPLHACWLLFLLLWVFMYSIFSCIQNTRSRVVKTQWVILEKIFDDICDIKGLWNSPIAREVNNIHVIIDIIDNLEGDKLLWT